MNPLRNLLVIFISALFLVFLSCGNENNDNMNTAMLLAAGNTSRQNASSEKGNADLTLSVPGQSSGATRAIEDVTRVSLEINAPDMT